MNIFIQRALFIKDFQRIYKEYITDFQRIYNGLTKDLSRKNIGELDQEFMLANKITFIIINMTYSCHVSFAMIPT